jgi:tRNA-uridine 2-sulfurtransferase
VVGIDAENRRVLVGEQEHLERRELTLHGVNWSDGKSPDGELRARCRIRYRHQEVPALITPLPAGRAKVVFDDPQRGVTPGQAAVFYDGDKVLGGGWIE